LFRWLPHWLLASTTQTEPLKCHSASSHSLSISPLILPRLGNETELASKNRSWSRHGKLYR
jgi:hypothetical protein